MTDTHFDEIVKILEEIHVKSPALRFGEVLQIALDQGKKGCNIDATDVSSKEIKKCLAEYRDRTKSVRKNPNNANIRIVANMGKKQ